MARDVVFVVPQAFAKTVRGVFSDEQLDAVKAKLALRPQLGDIILKTGGARKVRHVGHSGASRIIYYFHAGSFEIFFLACYPKNRKSDLSADERADLAGLVKVIKDARRV